MLKQNAPSHLPALHCISDHSGIRHVTTGQGQSSRAVAESQPFWSNVLAEKGTLDDKNQTDAKLKGVFECVRAYCWYLGVAGDGELWMPALNKALSPDSARQRDTHAGAPQ